jgi:hypothetical protein
VKVSITLVARLLRSELAGLQDNISLGARLKEAVAWCGHRADVTDPAGSLRHEQLRAQPLSRSRADVVQHAVRYRSNYVQRLQVASVAEIVDHGRLLLYFPDADLSDGAAELETRGFFDVFNTPPWDTWVGLFHRADGDIAYREFLICWIPSQFVSLAQRGIDVNPEACIDWLDDGYSPGSRAAAEWLLAGSRA